MMDKSDFIQVGDWKKLLFSWDSIPDEQDWLADPKYYLLLTRKGQVLVGWPDYPNERYMRGWRTAAGHLYAHDVIAMRELDIPLPLVREIIAGGECTNRKFRQIYEHVI